MSCRLMVSHDCGSSYHCEGTAESPEDFADAMAELADSMLRFYVEEENGDIVKWCPIHEEMVGFMKALREGGGNG